MNVSPIVWKMLQHTTVDAFHTERSNPINVSVPETTINFRYPNGPPEKAPGRERRGVRRDPTGVGPLASDLIHQQTELLNSKGKAPAESPAKSKEPAAAKAPAAASPRGGRRR